VFFFSLPYTDNVYLEHVINSRLTDECDDADVMRQTRSPYARANGVVRKFSSSSLCTKLLLFKAFCTPIYGCSQWCSMFQYWLNKLLVAYSDAFRFLLNEPRWCSASRLLYFIIFLHSRLLFVKAFTLCGAIVIMLLCRLFYYPIYACYRHFLRVGAPVFLVVVVFLVFLVCSCMFYVHCIIIHGLRACYWIKCKI